MAEAVIKRDRGSTLHTIRHVATSIQTWRYCRASPAGLWGHWFRYKQIWMKQYPSDWEQEEEEDMEQIHHREEATRCAKILSYYEKDNAYTAKMLGEGNLGFGVLNHYWNNLWCAVITSQFHQTYPLGLMSVFNILYQTVNLVYDMVWCLYLMTVQNNNFKMFFDCWFKSYMWQVSTKLDICKLHRGRTICRAVVLDCIIL